MDAVGLDSTYGAYLDQIPGVTLATVNLMSLFGLHRRLRGAIVGHLALFEMTSSVPNRRYANGLRRLGYGEDACLFFDVHVVADAVHESVAAVDLAGGLAKQDPKLGADVLWGAKALLAIDGRWARHMMEAWASDSSSLRPGARAAVTEEELRAIFDAPRPLTVGLEEEVMLVDPATLDLAPIAARDARRRRAASSSSCPRRRPRSSTAPAATRRRTRSRSSRPAAGGWPSGRRARARVIAAGRAPARRAARRSSTRASATTRSSPTTATSPASSSCARCRCTSPSAPRTRRSPSTTRCAGTCPSSPRWRPTRRSTPAATRASRPCAR